MPRKKMWVEWEDDANLSRSHKKPGDFSPLTRDGDKKLGHVTLSDIGDEDDCHEYYIDDSLMSSSDVEPAVVGGAPDISRLVPLALVALAAGFAGAKIAEYMKSHQEGSRSTSLRDLPAGAAPAGWYELSSDSARLRYWDGSAWTNDFAYRQQPVEVIPADWYPDPSNRAQLRYWDGRAWTHHVAPRDPVAAIQPTGVSAETGGNPALGEPRTTMSRAEWQAHVRAWMAAGTAQQELWRRLCNAHISDGDEVTLEAQRRMEQLTPEQGMHRIRLMLETNPSSLDHLDLADIMKLLGSGRVLLGHAQDASLERSSSTRHPRQVQP